jgi:predicted N-formylglutamate amidohydrolase
VPAEYAALFAGAGDVLATHRGFDLGAAAVARAFGRRLGVTPFTAGLPTLALRRNYPHSGVSDALVTHLRRRYGARGYVGLELEVNQKHVDRAGWRALVAQLAATLATAVAAH